MPQPGDGQSGPEVAAGAANRVHRPAVGAHAVREFDVVGRCNWAGSEMDNPPKEMPALIGFMMVYGARPTVVAEVVAQEAMLQAYRSWDAIDTPRKWIRTVAERIWQRQYAQGKVEVAYDELPESVGLLTPTDAYEIEDRHVVLSLLRELPLGQRAVMAYHYDGFTPTEIAAQLGKPPGTVRATLRDARAALRRRLPPRDTQETS